jgi:hypothetical protein
MHLILEYGQDFHGIALVNPEELHPVFGEKIAKLGEFLCAVLLHCKNV